MEQWDQEGRLYFPKKPGGRIQRKRFLEEVKGKPVQSLWDDIDMISSRAEERLGYPTQKPIALLDRIIKASTKEGDVVFDPFCGCGTAIYAAHLNKRKWIGCDIAILSVGIVRTCLLNWYGLREGVDYEVTGIPLSVDGARDLCERDPTQFQHWAVELAGGFCSNRQSGDRGIDGRIYFETRGSQLRSMVISVKGGHVNPSHLRELRGVLEREDRVDLAGFICLEKPTKGMIQEAGEAGMFEHLGKKYPRIQIRTIEDLLDKRYFDTPSRVQTMDRQRQAVLPLV